MKTMPADGSRDRRIEDPSNLWLIHPASRALLPRALAIGISANTVSVIGLLLGTFAALCYYNWTNPVYIGIGLLLTIFWLIADGLDGMVARATGTASPLGRVLDGVCDHGVFILIYVAIATRIGTGEGWALALSAGACHIVQSSVFEGERARFHRRLKGIGQDSAVVRYRNPVVRGYDMLAGLLDRLSVGLDRMIARPDERAFRQSYGEKAAPALKFLSLESANVRVWAVFIACALGNPRLFWWFEIVVLTAILVVGTVWHRRIETNLLRRHGAAMNEADRPQASF